MVGLGESGIPGEESLMGAVDAVEVDAPFVAWRRSLVAHGSERYFHQGSQDVVLFVDVRERFPLAVPFEAFFDARDVWRDDKIELLVGGGDFEFVVFLDVVGVGADERLDDVTIPEADALGVAGRFECGEGGEGAVVTKV